MKRKLIAVIMMVLMLLGTVGCSTEGLNLYQEMEKVGKWEYVETKGKVLVSAQMQGEKVTLGADFKGYSNTKQTQAYIEMNINEVQLGSEGINVDFSADKISPVKMYLDKQTLYISKTYFTDLLAMSGSPVPEALAAVEAEYIGLDLSSQGQAMLFDYEQAMQLNKVLFENSNVKLPVKQTGRSYTIDLNDSQIVDLGVAFFREVFAKMDTINEVMDTGLSQEEIAMAQEEIEQMLLEGKEMVKPMIAGSSAKVKYTFSDTAYQEDMNIAFKIAFGGETMLLDLSIQTDSQKIASKTFTLPASKQVYTLEEFFGLMYSYGSNEQAYSMLVAEISPEELVVKGKQNYLPLRKVMEQLDVPLHYNATTKKIAIHIEGEEIVLNTIALKGVSYISIEDLQAIEYFMVIADENGVTIIR